MAKKIIAGILTMLLMFSSAWSAMPIFADADELPVYRSSEEYQEEEGQNPTANWEWDYYDYVDEDYHKLEYLNNTRGFSIVPQEIYGNSTAVSDTKMYPDYRSVSNTASYKNDTGNDVYNNAWARYYPVRTFTAPKTGNITITAADDTITGGAKTAGPSVRILLEREDTKTNLWPGEDYNKQTQGVTDFDGWREIYLGDPLEQFKPITLNIKEGDKLRFEMSAEKRTSAAIAQHNVTWDPIVSYNSFVAIKDFQPAETDDLPLNQVFTITTEGELEPITAEDVSITGTTDASVKDFQFDGDAVSFAFDGLSYNGIYEVEIHNLKPVGSGENGETYKFTFTTVTMRRYQASESYVEGKENNPSEPWSWESYDLSTGTYAPLTNFNSSRGFAIVNGYNAVTAVNKYNMYGDTRQSGQGGFVADDTYAYSWQRYYAVRTFTVPESGNVTLSAVDENGESKITTAGTSTPNVRVMLERNGELTQLWPEEGWKAVRNAVPADFDYLERNVRQGDKIHFELSAAHATTGNCWQMYVHWDPVISYNEKHPTVTDISPKNGSVDVPGNTEFAVVFEEEICPPLIEDVSVDNGAEASEVWLENGNEVHILLDSTTLKENTSYTLRLSNIRLLSFNEYNSFEQLINFTTAAYTIYDSFVRNGSTVSLMVNNTLGADNPISVTVIAALCSGTEEDYIINEVRYLTRSITGRESLDVSFDAEPDSDQFIKAVAVTKPLFGKALTPMAVLK